jgi:hypothetical protein
MNYLGYHEPRCDFDAFELTMDGEAMLKKQTSARFLPLEGGWGDFLEEPYRTESVRTIGVCGCGEIGCDWASCRIRVGPETVVFDDFVFQHPRSSVDLALRFEVPRSNYDAIVAALVEKARQRRLGRK